MVPFAKLPTALSRHPDRFFQAILEGLGVLWLFAELAHYFFRLAFEGLVPAMVFLAIAGLWGFLRALPRTQITFRLGGTNTRVCVRFGDLFSAGGFRAIPVNEFFDGDTAGDNLVSSKSVHGQFIDKVLNGSSASFNAAVRPALAGKHSTKVTRPIGSDLRYNLGTAVVLHIAAGPFAGTNVPQQYAGDYILVASARTNLVDNKASASVPDTWEALNGLWTTARGGTSGAVLCLPLIGAGRAGAARPQHLLQLILVSLLQETQQRKTIADKVEIVLHESQFDDIDLSSLDWFVG